MQVPFAEWAPDQATFDSPYTANAVNAYPIDGGYGPVKGVAYALGNLPEGVDPRTIIEFESESLLYRFLGAPEDLWLWNVATNEFELVSGPQAPFNLGATARWGFTQYGVHAIATNGFDNPQDYVMGSDFEFGALDGDPMPFLRTTVHKDFLFGIHNDDDGILTVWNSGLGSPEVWDGTLLSDAQAVPEGGPGTGIVAGECVLAFQRNRIHRFIFT